MNTFQLSRRMGTSIDMIDRHYGHLIGDADASELAMLDAFDAKGGSIVDPTTPEAATE